MPWRADLRLRYSRAGDATHLSFSHDGPLRVLKSLYPEGPGVCHSVMVHPPGGLVSGDDLRIDVTVERGAHALISTPGATRFYKSTGEQSATQTVKLHAAEGARLEWVPLEAIAYPGCDAANNLALSLEPGAQAIGWDVTSLGLPAAKLAFDDPSLPRASRFAQSLHWPGHWQERAVIAGGDVRLLGSPLGLSGWRCMGTLWFASGSAVSRTQMEALADALRASWLGAADASRCGCSWLDSQLLVVRCLGPLSEPVMQRMQRSWAVLRREAWGMDASSPRIWAV